MPQSLFDQRPGLTPPNKPLGPQPAQGFGLNDAYQAQQGAPTGGGWEGKMYGDTGFTNSAVAHAYETGDPSGITRPGQTFPTWSVPDTQGQTHPVGNQPPPSTARGSAGFNINDLVRR